MSNWDLYALYYSPWSERARWGLDYCGLEYRYHEHIPFLGERSLRRRARPLGQKKVTAPLLVTGDQVVMDSFEILKHVDAAAEASALFADPAAMERWNEAVKKGLAAGRSRTVGRYLQDPEALREGAMAVSPKFLAGLFRPLAAHSVKYLRRKYAMDGDEAAHEADLRAALQTLRDGLNGQDYLVGGAFSAADIVATSLLQFVQPVKARHMRLPPATRTAWSFDELAKDFADLVAWRDAMYARHRFAN